MTRPSVLVVTGPSGAGKGTLIRELLRRVPDLEVTISATTRERRPGEEDGREYRFLNQCRISQSKTVGGLSDRQRAELIGLFNR